MISDRQNYRDRRAVSAGAVWSVGGTIVTEGVASTPNGRGGRVTSGTNAPHYNAGFLKRQTASEDEARHGKRLAVALDLKQSSKMLTHGQSRSLMSHCPGFFTAASNRRVSWINSAWERSGMPPLRPSQVRKQKDVPIIPFRVLDAPALRDDYYCSLLAYSHTLECLAVGLGPHVYLWSEKRGSDLAKIPEALQNHYGSHVTSVSFSSIEAESAILAIGRADGRVTLWSPQDEGPRFDSDQPSPVSFVSFRPNSTWHKCTRAENEDILLEELLVGDEAGNVYLYFIEWPDALKRDLFDWPGSMTLVARISCHTQQVCGIAWSSSGEFFATGGNDNQLYVFERKHLLRAARTSGDDSSAQVKVINNKRAGDRTPAQGRVLNVEHGHHRHVFQLNAAVKAIAFAPWQPSLLAAGGGSNDRCIHFFHALSGATLATIDCHAQVTSLVWSERRREIAATFGFAQPDHPYRVAVFAWPSCRRIVAIPWWGEERALYAIAYPGGPSGGPSSRQQRGQRGPAVEGRA